MQPLEKELAKLQLNLGTYSPEDIYPILDLTKLKKDATEDEIRQTYKAATNYNMAAICIYPEHYKFIPDDCKIQRATVVNFPNGDLSSTAVIAEIDKAINLYNIDEIDYVFPYQDYLGDKQNKAIQHCQESIKICQKYNKTFKVIIESGAFPDIESIYNLSQKLINSGCDFIKTSTGKINKGASPESAFAILSAIKDSGSSCGIKVSGGIRSFKAAQEYIKLAEHVLGKTVRANWFRIGTSGLVNN